MLRLKHLLSASLLLLSAFCGIANAAEIDLIYNLSGPDATASKAAWHGAHIAKATLAQQGNQVDLVLYNGQSVEKLNAAIGKMRAKSKSTSIVIGLGNPQEMTAAAKPLIAANKIFIAASRIQDKDKLGNNFFTVSAEATTDSALFESQYEARFHKKPTAAAYNGYNAVMLAASALKNAPDQSATQLAMAIKKLSNGSKTLG